MKYKSKITGEIIDAFFWTADENLLVEPEWFLEELRKGALQMYEKGTPDVFLNGYYLSKIPRNSWLCKDKSGRIFAMEENFFGEIYENFDPDEYDTSKTRLTLSSGYLGKYIRIGTIICLKENIEKLEWTEVMDNDIQDFAITITFKNGKEDLAVGLEDKKIDFDYFCSILNILNC